jgi:hypothetical protein
MSKLVLEKELHLIRERLESIEDMLGEEMTSDDKEALEEAMKEHRKARPSPSRHVDQGPASVEGLSVAQGSEGP